MRRVLTLLLFLSVTSSAQIVICSLSPPEETRDDGLIAFWKMDETSGNRTDAVGSMVLTDNNTVGYGTGKYTNAADFEHASTEYFSVADNATVSFGPTESFTVSFWYKAESRDGLLFVSKASNINALEWAVGAGSYNYIFSTGNNAFSRSTATSDSSVGVGYWQFICSWYNASTDSIYIRVNNGKINREKATYGPTDGAADVLVGAWAGYTSYADGMMDCLSIYSRCPQLTGNYAMCDSLYNSGSGWEPE